MRAAGRGWRAAAGACEGLPNAARTPNSAASGAALDGYAPRCVPRRLASIMLPLLPLVFGGCDTLSLKHMMGEGARLWEHPWHSVPFKLVGFVAIVGVGV